MFFLVDPTTALSSALSFADPLWLASDGSAAELGGIEGPAPLSSDGAGLFCSDGAAVLVEVDVTTVVELSSSESDEHPVIMPHRAMAQPPAASTFSGVRRYSGPRMGACWPVDIVVSVDVMGSDLMDRTHSSVPLQENRGKFTEDAPKSALIARAYSYWFRWHVCDTRSPLTWSAWMEGIAHAL